jgi:Cu(I)/Ag(I) efflux system membrane protein CusA/SilA
MIETFIQLKPHSEWREGVTRESLRAELDALVKLPGVTNAWVMPIKTRIDMLATGIKTPVGIKIAGPKLTEIQAIGQQLEKILKDVDGTASVYSERVAGGRYIKIDIDREKAARFNLSIADIQQVIATAIGGMNVTQTVEGLERYPVNIRYPQSYRDSPEQLQLLPIVTAAGQRIALADVADIYIEDGPAGIKSENARTNGWAFIDIEDIDVGTYVENAKAVVERELTLPTGYSITWSGQYEYMQRAKAKLGYVVPLTIALIAILLFMSFRTFAEPAIIIGTLPLGIVGGIWLLYWFDFNFSIAVGVGFIALAGIAVETAVLMLVYLNLSWKDLLAKISQGEAEMSKATITQAVLDGATQRVRPVLMTAGADIAGLLPIMYSTGTGSEIMSRLAAPMVGGMITAITLTLLVVPTVYMLWKLKVQNVNGESFLE